jgi:eukaryotic-like serine/threonine-protein kinase
MHDGTPRTDLDTQPSSRAAEGLGAGTLVDGRFTVEDLAGQGGMGHVYRARDGHSGERVALKLLRGVSSRESLQRFQREAALLSQLRHPGLVAYVAHGACASGQPYLVMQWLEGESLAHRLARAPLSPAESLALVRRTAEALAHAHARGIVHRDLKPSNLLLLGGRPEDVVLLDFGLARLVAPSTQAVTGSHTVVGSPGYMAPEQASGAAVLTPAVDVFALGCVLYECLTGQPPFEAPHFAAALAKILCTEPEPPRALCPHLPEDLCHLVERMLSKAPERRPADAARLLDALASLSSLPDWLPRAPRPPAPVSLAAEGQRTLVSVLLFAPREVEWDATPDWERSVVLRDSMRAVLGPSGGRVELLAGGAFVGTLAPERGAATDQALVAARCALLFKERWPELVGVLVTGVGVLDARQPAGEVMDKAGRLLRGMTRACSSAVLLDEVTAGLLGPGFQLSRFDSDTFLLHGERSVTDASRPLMGKPTPCVGREQELAFLEVTLTSCVEENSARAVLVTAAPGVGKSRLRHEFLRRLARDARPVRLLWGRGEPVGVGTTHGPLGQALRRWFDIEEGSPLDVRRRQLREGVEVLLPKERPQDVVEFLGELCAVPFPDEHSPRLRTARGEPRLMTVRTAQALVALLHAECARRPVLLVLEDLHWSDALTVTLVDALLRDLSDQPLFVLALARPEVKQLFPDLWTSCVQELRLKGLSRKAGERLVREVLGGGVTDSTVAKVVERSDGNALLLEELIRGVAEGRGEAVPETVLAVLQRRVSRMESGARRVLQAASLLGPAFWAEGVGHVLGEATDSLRDTLRRLVEQEVIAPSKESRFAQLEQYHFRHALVRDAVQALVPEAWRVEAHRLAGDWLEARGEPDEMVLAAHFHQGQRPERAVHWYLLAAERLFEHNDFPGLERCVAGALACGVSGEPLARLRTFQALGAFSSDEVRACRELGTPALGGLRMGSALWCRLAARLFVVNLREGNEREGLVFNALLAHVTPEPDALADFVDAIVLQQTALLWVGDRTRIDQLHERIRRLRVSGASLDARVWSRMLAAEALFEHHLGPRPWRALLTARESMRHFQEAGLDLDVHLTHGLVGALEAALGDTEAAFARLRWVRGLCLPPWQDVVILYAELFLLEFLTDSPRPEHTREARVLALDWLGRRDSDTYKFLMAHFFLAKVLAREGALDEAERYGRQACTLLASLHSEWIKVQAVLSSILLRQGKVEDAWREARLGQEQVRRMRNAGAHAVASHLALAEASFARGSVEEGEAVLREAVACVRARASDIPEPAARERFLTQVAANARVLALARERWGEG